MKTRIVMIIMAVALIALPAMAQQQEWQSTSVMQGSGSSYSSQVTAVGASEVSDMGTTTTLANGPRRAKKDGETEGSDFGPGAQTGGYQDPNSPIGDAWPMLLFAALFAIVITIKKYKQTMMKKNINTILFIAALLMSNGAWADVSMPAGTYYFDLSAFTGDDQLFELDVFVNINSEDYIGFSTDSACNSGVNVGASAKNYRNTDVGFNQLVLTINTAFTKGGGFVHARYGTDNGHTEWTGWTSAFDYSSPTAIKGTSNVYVCKMTKTGYVWGTEDSDIPDCSSVTPSDPTLTFTAGANGSITTQTAGGAYVSTDTKVAEGTIINLVATPNSGYAFYGWCDPSGEIVSEDANYLFFMPSTSVNLRATFYADNTDPSISGCAGCFKVAP